MGKRKERRARSSKRENKSRVLHLPDGVIEHLHDPIHGWAGDLQPAGVFFSPPVEERWRWRWRGDAKTETGSGEERRE